MTILFNTLTGDLLSLVREHVLPPKPVFSAEELSSLERFIKASALKPEGVRPFDLSEHKHLRPLYAEERDNPFRRVVVMKAAQMGLTIRLLNRAFWFVADANQMINTALGFPSQDAVRDLSKSRFRPMLRSSSKMLELAQDVTTQDLVRIGASNMRFRGMKSGISMDSFPADVILLDEVRLMSIAAIERVRVRLSESTLRGPAGERGILELNSTAGFPGMDIHRYFERSTMGYFATRCPNRKCSRHKSGVVLPLEFAENPARVVGEREGRYFLKCPRCGERLSDQQSGFYQHQHPDAEYLGFQFSQLLKGEDYLNTEIMPAWNRSDNKPEFYNSRLGLPYEDTTAVPAPRAVVLDNCDVAYRWPLAPLGRDGALRAMGLDQRAGEKHVVIKTLLPDGHHRLDHLEVVEADGLEAAERVAELARDWGVLVYVGDGEPSYDLFKLISDRLTAAGVDTWLQDYVDGVATIVRWEDRHREKSLRKSTGQVKYEKRALLDRYKAIDWSLGLFTRRRNQLPADLLEAVQTRTIGGVSRPMQVGEEFVTHLGNIARAKVQHMQTLANGERIPIVGEYSMAWRNLRLDPHFVHANLYADIGLSRLTGQNVIMTASYEPPKPQSPLEAAMPFELRPSTLAQDAKARQPHTCADCFFFQGGFCRAPSNAGRDVVTTAQSPSCPEFRPLKRK